MGILFIFLLVSAGNIFGADLLEYWCGQYNACDRYEQRYQHECLPYIALCARMQVLETLAEEKICIQKIVVALHEYVSVNNNIWQQRLYLQRAYGWKMLLESFVRDRQYLEYTCPFISEEKKLEDVATGCAEFVLRESKEGDDEGCARACRQRQMPWAGDEDEKEDRE